MTTSDDLDRELAFTLSDAARLLRNYADQQAHLIGLNRAKWAVLSKLERFEGMRQSELADLLDIRPITLTQLLDGLSDSGLIERHPDPDDRRAKRLFLTPTARPVLEELRRLSREVMATTLEGFDAGRKESLLCGLSMIKRNLKNAIRPKNCDGEEIDD